MSIYILKNNSVYKSTLKHNWRYIYFLMQQFLYGESFNKTPL